MQEPSEAKLSKWPFFLGDALLLVTAWFILHFSQLPVGPWQMVFLVLCVSAGACLGVAPFLLEYRVAARLLEASALTTVAGQLRQLESLAAQISGATGQWQAAQESADKTTAAAKGIAERMTAEAQAFTEFMQKVNDSEKGTLRLEVEKLRRAEADWLHVLMRVLDHTYALNQGARRSGQPNLIEQLGNFQNACRDAARRVGLAPFVAQESEAFDPQRHQSAEGNGPPPAGAVVSETVATGYTFQGKLVRPALVRLQESRASDIKVITSAPGDTAAGQSQLPLESSEAK